MRCSPGHLHLHLPTLIRDDAAHLGPISRPHLFCSVVQTKVYSFTEIKLRKADILGLPSALIPPFANDGLSGARPAQASTDRPDPLDFTCDLTRPAAHHVKVTSSGLLTHLLTKKCRMDSTTESPSLGPVPVEISPEKPAPLQLDPTKVPRWERGAASAIDPACRVSLWPS
jgi:hypothetical protein